MVAAKRAIEFREGRKYKQDRNGKVGGTKCSYVCCCCDESNFTIVALVCQGYNDGKPFGARLVSYTSAHASTCKRDSTSREDVVQAIDAAIWSSAEYDSMIETCRVYYAKGAANKASRGKRSSHGGLQGGEGVGQGGSVAVEETGAPVPPEVGARGSVDALGGSVAVEKSDPSGTGRAKRGVLAAGTKTSSVAGAAESTRPKRGVAAGTSATSSETPSSDGREKRSRRV